MLGEILNISKWDVSVKQITDGNAHLIFQNCVVATERIEELLTEIEQNPKATIEELKKILLDKRGQLKIMQFEADDIMNQKFNL